MLICSVSVLMWSVEGDGVFGIWDSRAEILMLVCPVSVLI